jgi:hypothetical protein
LPKGQTGSTPLRTISSHLSAFILYLFPTTTTTTQYWGLNSALHTW